MSLFSSIKSFFTLTDSQKAIANNVSGKRRAGVGFNSLGYQNAASKYKTIYSASDLKLNANDIRLHARIGYFDSLVIHTIVDRLADCVVADGLQLESSPISDIVGFSNEELELWSRRTEILFKLYASDKNNHIEKNMTLYQLQKLCETQQHRDGEYFVRLYYTNEGIKFGLIDADQVIPDLYEKEYHQGVITDAFGAPIKYNIRLKETDNKGTLVPAYTNNGLPIILHGYAPVFAGQKRGYSRLAHLLQEAKTLTDYELAELAAAVQQSQYSFYIKPGDNAPSSGGGFDGAAFGVDTDNSETKATGNEEDETIYRELDEVVTSRPGAIGILGLGAQESYEPTRKTSPNLVFPPFFEAIAQYMSASMSVPLSIIKMLFHDSYSASRGELQLFWKTTVNPRRTDLSSDFLTPFHNVWFLDQVARGKISCPGFSDPYIRSGWLNHNWIGISIPQLDPNKQAIADKTYVQLGATTLKRVAREYNQSDAGSNRAQLQRELAELPEVPWNRKGKY